MRKKKKNSLRLAVAVTGLLAAISVSTQASAQECFLGEVKMFAGNFAPRGYALADGQLLPISQNSALFSLLGTMYGGDGRTTFGLPDLRGRVPVHVGNGPGLTDRRVGQRFGQEQVTLQSVEVAVRKRENPKGATATAARGGQAIDNMQPSLGINHIVCMQGIYPSRN